MMLKTWGRAEEIVEEGQIRLESYTPGNYHFKVQSRSKEWFDVWYLLNKRFQWVYECNVLDKSKKWSCCMNVNQDKSKPTCSHTKAVQIWLKKKELL